MSDRDKVVDLGHFRARQANGEGRRPPREMTPEKLEQLAEQRKKLEQEYREAFLNLSKEYRRQVVAALAFGGEDEKRKLIPREILADELGFNEMFASLEDWGLVFRGEAPRGADRRGLPAIKFNIKISVRYKREEVCPNFSDMGITTSWPPSIEAAVLERWHKGLPFVVPFAVLGFDPREHD